MLSSVACYDCNEMSFIIIFGIFAGFLPICQFKTSDLFQGGIGHVQQLFSGSLEQYLNLVAGNEFGNDSGSKGRVFDPVAPGKGLR
jgi:hypothetical protein